MADNNTDSRSVWLSQLSNEELRDKALSRDAVVVYSADLSRVLWANSSGAQLFGGNGVGEFLDNAFEADHPFIRQLASAVKQLGKERIYRGFRVVDDMRSKLLLCEIGNMDFKREDRESEPAIIISCANAALGEKREHEYIQLVLDSLETLGNSRAICDEFGLVMAASDGFIDVDILPEEMEKACGQIDKDASTNLPVTTGEGRMVKLQLFPLGSNPVRCLVLIDDALEAENSPTTETKQVPDENSRDHQDDLDRNPKGFVGEMVAGMAAASTALFGKQKSDTNDEKTTSDSLMEASAGIDGQEEEHDGLVDGEELSDTNDAGMADDVQDNDGLIDEDEVPRIIINDDLEELDQGEDELIENDEFVFSAASEPIRFAWTTDTSQTFTSISDELAQAVGPNAADVVGRKWSDVATVFGFDSNGEINSLLQKQDTWSGKSVLWPIQGTDLLVPVDLAALPAFTRGRDFNGFRGFGIVRMLDTIVDPEETGLALVDGSFTPKHSGFEDEGKSEGVDTENDTCEANEETNVVNLKLHRELSSNSNADDLKSGLSNGEHKAFDEIGRKLREPTNYNISKLQKDNGAGEGLLPAKHEENKRQETSKDERSLVDTSILEALPIPVIVFRGNETLFANQELLNLTGYSDFSALQSAGGIDGLLGIEDDNDLSQDNYTILNDCDGGRIQVRALLKTVPWDEERAMLMSFRQPRHEELPQDEKIVLDMMQVSELQNILNTATDGIVIVNREGEIQSVNPSAEALFGQSDESCRGKPINDLFASESHDLVKEYLIEIDGPSSQTKLNDGREVIGVEAKGGLIPLYITIGKIGNSDKFCLVLRDMTPWKKAREDLIDARKQAEDASDQKTEFLARVSHEIRTPLNAIIGFSDVMIEERFGPIDNERYREYLRDINRSGVHVLDLVNDLLDISKIEAGKMELSFEAVDLNKIVAETVALLQPQANGNRVLIRTSLSRAVPNVVADARSLRQIVINLVSNAIKFTDANGQVIISTVYEGNGEVALRVRDTGRGMSKEEIVIALKPFRQINSISEIRGQGTGLGLPLTKALVEANKAYLDIDSEPGEGTIVHIQFPTQRVLAD